MKLSGKKTLALLLAGLFLLPLASCATESDTDGEEVTTKAAETVEASTEDPNFVCELPDDLDFGGDEVAILYVKADGRADELYSEKLGFGTVSDAVYERNMAVENQLGVKLTLVDVGSDGEGDGKARSMVSAGDSSIDILRAPAIWLFPPP